MGSPRARAYKRWLEFHEANPHIYREIVERAFRLTSRGYTRFGLQIIIESIRYDHAIRTKGELYKINNTHAAFYSRKLVADYPVLADVIVRRKSMADDDGGPEPMELFAHE